MPATTAIAICILLFAGCSVEPANQQIIPEEESQRIPDQEGWNSTLVTTSIGKVEAKIRFGHMSKFNQSNEYKFDQNLHVDFYDKNGEPTSWLTSDRGTLNENTNMMTASGNVVAHSDSANLTLYTETLFWNEQRRKIISNDRVMLTTKQDTLYGLGFESEIDFSKWVIKKPWGHSSRPVELGVKKQLESESLSSQKQNE